MLSLLFALILAGIVICAMERSKATATDFEAARLWDIRLSYLVVLALALPTYLPDGLPLWAAVGDHFLEPWTWVFLAMGLALLASKTAVYETQGKSFPGPSIGVCAVGVLLFLSFATWLWRNA